MPDIALDTATLAELQAHLTAGDLTAVALAELCFARIDARDGGVNAIIERNPDALEIAAGLDAERADGRVRVELSVEPASVPHVPLQHGLPGTLEIQVERATPAALVLRYAGRLLPS